MYVYSSILDKLFQKLQVDEFGQLRLVLHMELEKFQRGVRKQL